MDITNLTDDQLKALGYDQEQELKRVQANLSMIAAEITRRASLVPPKPTVPVKDQAPKDEHNKVVSKDKEDV